MASNKKAPWSANVTYWTGSYSCKISGSMDGVIGLMFTSMPTERREKLLESLSGCHQRMKEKESDTAQG